MRMMSVVLAGMCALSQVALGANEVVVTSPGGGLSLALGVADGGQLSYRLSCRDRAVVESSALGITIDGQDLGRGVVLGAPTRWSLDETYPARGAHALARNHFNGAVIAVTHCQERDEVRRGSACFRRRRGLPLRC